MALYGDKARRNKQITTVITRIVLLVFTAIVLLPIIWTFYTSFKTSNEFLTNAWALPSSLHWENYKNALEKGNMSAYFLNSIYITILALFFMIILAVPTAYVTSRYKFKMAKPINFLFMAGLFVSQSYIVVPIFLMLNKVQTFLNQYVIFQHVRLLDNLTLLALVYAVTTLPFSIYLLSGFLRTIPHDYEEAASIDGCGYFGTLFRIILPMAKPAMVTVFMFDFMSYWNEYTLSMTILLEDKWTLPVGLQNLMEQQKFATDWGAMFAGMVIVMVPTMVIYSLIQNKLTQGISMGGLKG